LYSAKGAPEQCQAVADREEAHVQQDVLEPVEEEDHADQKEQVVVTRTMCFAPRYISGMGAGPFSESRYRASLPDTP